MAYTTHYNVRKTAQNQPIPGKDMVPNRAGGFVFGIDNWAQLDRFLILGSEQNTYYATAQEMTVENAENVRACIQEDGKKTVAKIVDVSQSGRAPKNEHAIFALAMCVAFGNKETRQLALLSYPEVCRIGTHQFTFMQYCKDLNVPSNRSFRKAICAPYEKDANFVAYQVLKYQGRTVNQGDKSSRWTHKDVLRLGHPNPATIAHSAIFRWAIHGELPADCIYMPETHQIAAYESAKTATTEKELVGLISEYNLTREMVPTQWLNSPAVWEALLEKMPLTAMIRNLGKMTNVGLLKPMSHATNIVKKRLNNQEYLNKSRIHPLNVLIALKTYERGQGMRGSLAWTPNTKVIDSLDNAFYLSFGNVEPTGKRTMLALDVSASMTWDNVAGMPITPREASAAMAMVTAKTERDWMVTAFSNPGYEYGTGIKDISISPRMRLDTVMRTIDTMHAGGTDCSLPMIYALNNGLEIDTFIIYTDNETWFGNIHPSQALKEYRKRTGINAKLIVCAMISSGYSIADPSDNGMLDVVGFDTATPQIMSEFAKG